MQALPVDQTESRNLHGTLRQNTRQSLLNSLKKRRMVSSKDQAFPHSTHFRRRCLVKCEAAFVLCYQRVGRELHF